MIRWAGFPFFFWALGLADGFLAISFHVLSTVGYWACWALDLWWITEVLDLVYRGPKKWASTTTMFETTACRTINHLFMFSACRTNSNYRIILFLLFSCLLRLFCLCFLRLSLALFVNVRCFFFFFFRSKRCSYLVGVRWIMCNVLLCIMTQLDPCNMINK
jgi:hypothetical protein